MDTTPSPDYFGSRLAEDARRVTLWQILWKYSLGRALGQPSVLVELGSGRCEFINSADSETRIAVDLWPGIAEYAGPGVDAHNADATDLSFINDGTVDAVFASNLVEHLTRGEAALLFQEANRVLKPGGKIALVQPNFRVAFRRYFDDFTHVSIWTDTAISDFLVSLGWHLISVQGKYLPLTIKSRIPFSPLLVRAYLKSPWKPMAGQMLVVAAKPA